MYVKTENQKCQRERRETDRQTVRRMIELVDYFIRSLLIKFFLKE